MIFGFGKHKWQCKGCMLITREHGYYRTPNGPYCPVCVTNFSANALAYCKLQGTLAQAHKLHNRIVKAKELQQTIEAERRAFASSIGKPYPPEPAIKLPQNSWYL